MADSKDWHDTRDSRADRRDAALVAEYIHELSERHGGSDEPDSPQHDADSPDELAPL
ncbi:MAG: hypothetical protein ACRDM7_20575 [Thermoleophilaceae bacterium]